MCIVSLLAAERTKGKVAAGATAVAGGVSTGARYVYDARTGTFKVAANTASAADKAKDLVEEYGPYAAAATLATPQGREMAPQSVQAAARGATSLASQVTPDQLATALYFGAPAAALATGGLSLRTAPSAMDVAQRRQAKDHLEYMLRRRRRDIAEEVEVMDREDPYEKPEDNPDDEYNEFSVQPNSPLFCIHATAYYIYIKVTARGPVERIWAASSEMVV